MLSAEPPPPASQGRVLLLEHGRALEGDVRAERDGYSVKRTTGEIWLPANKVIALCATWEKALAFMRSQANLNDPDEHLRLARWCQAYGLRAQALEEASAAVKIRPGHVSSKQLLAVLQHQLPAAENRPAPEPLPVALDKPARTAPAIDLSTEAFAMFSARVQPVLMNTCASCHAASKTTAFRLMRASGNNQASRRATQQNMAVVLTQIDPARPNASPLLLCAVTDHGKAGQAPLKAQSPPYRILNDWIQLTLATNPFLREQATAAAPPTPGLAKGTEIALSQGNGPTEPRKVSAEDRAAPVISRPLAAPHEPSVPPPANRPAATGPVDDFDPLLYNRQFHPERKETVAQPGPTTP
jgi:hypothetical protein